MKFTKNTFFVLLTLAFVPALALAQTDIFDLVIDLANLLSNLLPVVVGLGIVVFLWGLVKFIYKAGDQTARDEGKKVMLWGIVAIFVMISIWGIVRFIQVSLRVEDNTSIPIPRIDLAPYSS